MIALGYKIEPRNESIEWVSYDSDHLICIKYRGFRHNPRRMRLADPSSIVNDIFALESYHLQDNLCV